MLIGLTGKKRRGKDTVANYLVESHGFTRYGFADKVKESVYSLNPLVPMGYSDLVAMELDIAGGLGGMYRLQDVVNLIGWEEAKEIPEVRALLQRSGTEAGRSVFWKDFWVDILFKTIGTDVFKENIVISDVRFDNEAERIHKYGGRVFRVESNREGLPAPDNHASEQDISFDLIDGVIYNNGSFEELYAEVEKVLK